jgi:hypothetical protein
VVESENDYGYTGLGWSEVGPIDGV